ncbi:MAG: hypothetical protein RLZZ47_1313, partial [Bacteroidota bacterium]
SGDILAEVETDKATMDMEVYAKGTILHLALNEGDTTPVDSIIAIVGAPGEEFKSLLGSAPVASAPAPVATPETSAPAATVAPVVEAPAVTAAPCRRRSIESQSPCQKIGRGKRHQH